MVKTRSGDFGWSAEFAIPFTTLRYGRESGREWGLNFQRNVRRRNESSFWAPLPRQYDLFRVSRAGTLAGLEPPPQRNLKLLPYALGETTEKPALGQARDTTATAGGDLKWSVTPSLALDATVNTDFAQVEVDEQQVNLDRFSLFYPEKRPFFLENAGLFTLGSPGEVDLFFSRRIGIGPVGRGGPDRRRRAPVRQARRLQRRPARHADAHRRHAGPGQQLRRGPRLARAAEPLAGRRHLRQPRGHRRACRPPATTTGRTGPTAAGASAATAPSRATWRRRRRRASRGATTPSTSGRASARPAWELNAEYTEVGGQLQPGGRLPRAPRLPQARGRRSSTATARSDFLGLLEVRPHVSYRGYWKPDGFQESGFLHVDNHLEWKSGWEVHTGINFTQEGVLQPFEIYPGVVVPPGSYDNREAMLVLITNQGAPLSLETRWTLGGFFGGSRVSAVSTLRGRIGEAFNSSVDYTRNDVSLPEGRFVTNLLRMRLSYSFSTRVYVQALLQYNDVIDNWSTNLRFGWLQAANTGLFVVYNENRDTERDPLGLGVRDRSFTIKYSHTFDLLDYPFPPSRTSGRPSLVADAWQAARRVLQVPLGSHDMKKVDWRYNRPG